MTRPVAVTAIGTPFCVYVTLLLMLPCIIVPVPFDNGEPAANVLAIVTFALAV